MYRAEVLSKFPVIQHTFFGSIFTLDPCSKKCPRIEALEVAQTRPGDVCRPSMPTMGPLIGSMPPMGSMPRMSSMPPMGSMPPVGRMLKPSVPSKFRPPQPLTPSGSLIPTQVKGNSPSAVMNQNSNAEAPSTS